MVDGRGYAAVAVDISSIQNKDTTQKGITAHVVI